MNTSFLFNTFLISSLISQKIFALNVPSNENQMSSNLIDFSEPNTSTIEEEVPLVQISEPSQLLTNKIQTLTEQKRQYRVKGDCLIYDSKEGSGKALNNKAFDYYGDKIVCRHLSWALVSSTDGIANYHSNFSSIENISKVPALKYNDWDTLYRTELFTYYHFFEIDTFSAQLVELANSLEKGEESTLLFYSSIHAMAISVSNLQREDTLSEYKVTFYDPNKTDKHVEVIASKSDDLLALSIDDLMGMSFEVKTTK